LQPGSGAGPDARSEVAGPATDRQPDLRDTVGRVPSHRSGLIAGVGAYVLWGLFPLYWPLLEPAGPVEILAHRIGWSLVFLVGLVALTSGFRFAGRLDRRQIRLLALASVLITVNWGTFIYGVNSDRVVETSLGYFINPLVTVALAVFVLGERLRAQQKVAVAIAALAVVVLTVDYGRPPYIALVLAVSFAVYGLTKKRANVDGTQSLTIETAFLVIPALVFLVVLQSRGEGTLTTEGAGHVALLAGGGIATAVPLILFGVAAIRVPLATVGLLQYLAPVMQFLIGVLVYGEPMPLSRLAGFALVWVALVIFAVDAVRASRDGSRQVPAPTPVEAGAAGPLLAGR
jgi:chloramphenicol-sensitive protein RarD